MLAENPPTDADSVRGYRVVNQFDRVWSCNKMAEMVKEVGESEFDLNVEVEHIPNPRVEPERHYYNPEHEKLYRMGWWPSKSLRDGLVEMFEDLLPHKSRIVKFKEFITPKIKWR